MRPTRPLAERLRAHEARGEWPQPSLWTLLEARARAIPDRPYWIEGARAGGRTWTFRDLHTRAGRMAGGLRRLGIGRGEVVSWQLPNWFEGAALAAAIERVGAVSNPIITIYREQEIGFVVRQARSRALVVPGVVRGVDHRELAQAVRERAPALEHVLTVRARPGDRMHALEALECQPDDPPTPPGPHDVAAVFYTSGTTADPKGVLHTPSTLGGLVHAHRLLLHPGADDRSLLQFPLTHIGGVTMFVLLPVVHGSSVVAMDAFDPALAVELVERHAVTAAGGPPAILQAMLAAPNFSSDRMRSVRTSGSGAADVSPALMRRVEEGFGVRAYRSYGLTECPMFTSGAPQDPTDKRHGTDGRPLPGCVARLVDEDGHPVGAGVEGEVEAFGPQLCVGYVDPALEAAFTPDGFFRTGDLAVRDEDGFLRITGRRKDVILRKGETLSAKGIEDEIAAHPKVADVAVVGVPDAARGERVCACVVLRPDAGGLALADLRTFMEGRGVMRQRIPEQLEVLAELPRNATGKVRKDVLRTHYRGSP